MAFIPVSRGIVAFIKKESIAAKELPGGVTEYTLSIDTVSCARVLIAILTVGLSEIFRTRTEIYTYVYKDEYLGDNRMDAALAANEKGQTYQNEKKYKEAVEWFNAAFTTAVNGNDTQTYKDNMYCAKAESLNDEGDRLFDQCKYDAAIVKYTGAFKECPVTKIDELNKYRNNEANSLNRQGLNFLDNKKYDCAVSKFDAAYARCTDVYCKRNLFKDNMDLAKAEALNEAGEKLHNETKYAEAILKYKDAHNQCPSSRTNYRKKYIDNEAKSLNSQGLELLDEGDYVGATFKFNIAYEKCTSDYSDRQIIKSNIKLAKAEALNAEGDRLHIEGNYADAILNYEASYKSYRHSKYLNNVAYSLNAHGVELLKIGHYADATDEFTAAYEKCTVDSDKKAFQDNLNYAKSEMLNETAYNQCPLGVSFNLCKYLNNTANSFNAQGLELQATGNCADIVKKLNSAYQKCVDVYSNKQTFHDNMNNAEALNKEGDQLCAERKYKDTFLIYEAAYNKSSTNKESNLYVYKNNMANALYNIGLMATGNKLEAANCFNKAYSECVSGFEKELIFKYMRDKVLKHRDTPACIFRRAQYLVAEGMSEVENHDRENTIVIGNSLGGKSTVINYLLCNSLEVKKDKASKKLKIFAVDKEAGPEIEATFNSTTADPKKQCKLDAVYKKAIWDCPGFTDNRGPAMDISNACLLSKLLSNITNIRIVLVVDFGDIDGNAARFVDLMKQVKCLFGDLDKIKQCSMLLVTKVDDYNVNELMLLSKLLKI